MERGHLRYLPPPPFAASRLGSAAVLSILPALAASGCCWLGPGAPVPEGIARWQDPSPPKLSLHEKAAAYQDRIEKRHLTPEGILRYQRKLDRPDDGSYGDLADGPFHTGIYLASQALRHAATRDPAAFEQVRRALNGLRILMEVTGKRGLLARYFSPAGTISGIDDPEANVKGWRHSTAHPELVWRGDVSKDQYSGFIHGLGVTLALVNEPGVRAEVAALAAAAADHLIQNHMQIIDADGGRTTHGNLAGRVAFVPIGVNALISLAIAKVAAVSTQDQPQGEKYRAFYAKLIAEGYARRTYWAHFTVFGVGNRVNDNMSALALYPLLLLEKDPEILGDLLEGDRRTWAAVKEDRNAFFSFVHASKDPREEGREEGRTSLFEFPDDKVEWPVDLTRAPYDFPHAFLNTRKCEPRTTKGVPLYLRARSSSFWASDPFRLRGNLTRTGNRETAGGDYLVAYWMGRHHGFVGEGE